MVSPTPLGRGWGEGERGLRPCHRARSSEPDTRRTRVQFLTALDIQIHRTASGGTAETDEQRLRSLRLRCEQRPDLPSPGTGADDPQGCSKVGSDHSKPETRKPKSELIATPAEQQPIESGLHRDQAGGLVAGVHGNMLGFYFNAQGLEPFPRKALTLTF